MLDSNSTTIPTIQRYIAVLWPSFITAGIATIILFTIFDPVEIAACVGGPEITRLGAYTLGFFSFWVLTSSSCLLATYFNKPCPQVNAADSN